MRPLLFLALVSLAGCTVPTTALNDLARARRADEAGQTRAALRLYRAAGQGGSLEAQLYLASLVDRQPSVAARLVSPAPDAAERDVWLRAATATAARRAAQGDAEGHVALGLLAAFGPDRTPGEPASDAALAEARTHFATAARLGEPRAAQMLAATVWMSDGLLAAEPYFRASHAAGNESAAGLLSLIALQRPALERGERAAPGDLSRLDAVGWVRTLREVDPAQAEARLASLRSNAGTAEADSLIGVLGAAGLF